jgi:hypothetical protein
MNRVKLVIYGAPDAPTQAVEFGCPGCHRRHCLPFKGPKEPLWGFDGNYRLPTISPSIMSGSANAEGSAVSVCHSFVKAGRIEFLNDCTHKLAGVTVDMPEVYP